MPSQLNYILLWLNRILVLKQAYFVYLIHREITTHHDGVMYIMPEHGIYNADMPNPQGILQPIHVLCPLSTRSASIFQSFNVEWSRRYESCMELVWFLQRCSLFHTLLREYMQAGVNI